MGSCAGRKSVAARTLKPMYEKKQETQKIPKSSQARDLELLIQWFTVRFQRFLRKQQEEIYGFSDVARSQEHSKNRTGLRMYTRLLISKFPSEPVPF